MIQINGIQKQFNEVSVLADISFDLKPASTLSILGKSGCGKTTLLKILAGLEIADAGKFFFEKEDLFKKSAKERGVVYLSQEPLLFPHLDVYENLAFGLRIRKVSEREIQKKVAELGNRLGITDQLQKMPEQISGGQRQRVSFGRALIINPAIMLLDEPFSSLDVQTRSEMQALYKEIASAYAITAIFVTHDLKEALIMGDSLAVMDAGKLKKYESREAFLQAPDTGVKEEFAFWKDMLKKDL